MKPLGHKEKVLIEGQTGFVPQQHFFSGYLLLNPSLQAMHSEVKRTETSDFRAEKGQENHTKGLPLDSAWVNFSLLEVLKIPRFHHLSGGSLSYSPDKLRGTQEFPKSREIRLREKINVLILLTKV